MIRTTCFLAVLSVLLFSSTPSAAEGSLLYMKDKTLSLAPTVVVNAMAFSPDDSLLAISGESAEDNCTPLPVQVWDVAAGKRLRAIEESASLEHYLGFSPDGTLLVRSLSSYIRDPTLVLYDTKTWTVKKELNSVKTEIGGEIEIYFHLGDPVRFLPNGNLLVQLAQSMLGEIDLDGNLQREYDFAPHPFASLRHVSPDSKRILIIEDRWIQKEFSIAVIKEFSVYDLATMEQTHTLSFDEWQSYGDAFFFDKEIIAFTLGSRTEPTPYWLWNLDNGMYGTLGEGEFPFASISYGVSVHPSGKEFVTGRGVVA